MALFEQGERERERDRASTDRFYCGTKRSRVRSILFSFFVRGIDGENAHAKYATIGRQNAGRRGDGRRGLTLNHANRAIP